ncbi:uncharacterized protein [Parasteatoda tepidariorum]|uniref:uncharacterized protein n=1 Tax=Parasteatoda tepidariorum TaxID=114398 RepID=UPI001C722E88|nr:uncharacterized protein LOC122272373 [Parasteatoda tepidariorum]
MKGLVTLCFVISWTVICGTVLAQNDVDYESDKSQDDLEELSRLLKEEELFKTNLKRLYNVLNDDDGEEAWETCEDKELKCPTKTSKCAGGPNTFYCACEDGYKPKSGNEINNKEGCVGK